MTKIYNYFKEKGYKTEVMGASFRNVQEIKELAGCDLLTISPKFLEELDSEIEVLSKKLDKDSVRHTSLDYKFDERDFRVNMLEDQMASEKLSEGITGFSKAIEELEILFLIDFPKLISENLIAL